MKTFALLSLLLVAALSSSCSKHRAITAPDAERITALMEFTGPVSLTRRIATTEDLVRGQKRNSIPVASFSYSDPARSSDTIVVTIFPAGAFYGEKRPELIDWLSTHSSKATKGSPAFGIFPTSDGRPIYQFPVGLGPGGGSYGALRLCQDARYELLLVQSTNFHDDEDPKAYIHHVSPAKDLKSVIEAVERLVFP